MSLEARRTMKAFIMILALAAAEGDQLRSYSLNRRSRETKGFKSQSVAGMAQSSTRACTLGISPGKALATLLLITPGADAFNVGNGLSRTQHQGPRPGLGPTGNNMGIMSEKGARPSVVDMDAPKPALHNGAVAGAAIAALLLGNDAAIAVDAPASNLPTVAIATTVGTLLASASDDLLASITRDPVDIFYLLVAIAAVVKASSSFVTNAVEEAKAYDQRGSLANAAAAEMKKRERTAKRDAVQRNDVAYERLQSEAQQRANLRAKWKQFPGFKQGFEDEE